MKSKAPYEFITKIIIPEKTIKHLRVNVVNYRGVLKIRHMVFDSLRMNSLGLFVYLSLQYGSNILIAVLQAYNGVYHNGAYAFKTVSSQKRR